jgi:hypothetical protein
MLSEIECNKKTSNRRQSVNATRNFIRYKVILTWECVNGQWLGRYRGCLPTCPRDQRVLLVQVLTLRSLPRPLQDEKGRVAIDVIDARTQLLGDYGH